MTIWITVALLFLFSSSVCAQGEEENSLPGDIDERTNGRESYALGYLLSGQLQAFMVIPLDLDLLVKGFADGMYKRESVIPKEQLLPLVQKIQNEVQSRTQEQDVTIAIENLEKSKAFLEENSKQEGVITLPSGLQYKIIAQGEGPIPTEEDSVIVHYKGSTIDGVEFDDSFKRQQTATFKVNEVILGWKEALQLMPVGSIYEFYVPPELGYGNQRRSEILGPNQVLIFYVQLLEIATSREEL
eukprot:TRINITY_DN8068_c0_g1_i1.p1 TRINITY_DN8068_c0_g1~~TRINITY_DN8068_c0_g1_i1.p1  ORF type:complete len:243 (-),score=48.75 TRINITY_DN8068_c0_g1_i1:52-780(-)